MAAGGEALDALWARLAEATAQAGPQRELFLAKLALLLARELDDPARVEAAIAVALQDLTAAN